MACQGVGIYLVIFHTELDAKFFGYCSGYKTQKGLRMLGFVTSTQPTYKSNFVTMFAKLIRLESGVIALIGSCLFTNLVFEK
jgi:hypothetical protein